jgi:molybdate transport repressor ModE-like protein
MADRFRTEVDWEDIRFFAALARHGSLSAAARALAVNHATVARRVTGLERAIGVPLIERRPDGYKLTEAGRSALEAAAGMEDAAEILQRIGNAPAVAGLVRITATPSFAEGFLIARLRVFCEQHPDIDVELITDTRTVSLSRREADLAIRLGRPSDSELIARRVATLRFGFYAAPTWKERLAKGAEPILIGFDDTNAHRPEAVWLARHFRGKRFAFRSNSQISQATAAREGHGVAMLPHFLGGASAALHRVEIGPTPPPRELWLMRRRDGSEAHAVQVAREFLRELFQRERDFLQTGDAGDKSSAMT